MSGVSPEQVVEWKHAMAGMAELTFTYYTELRKAGFQHLDALTLTQAWMVAAVTQKHEESE